MQVILLPGMDGTGILFKPFLQELSENISEDIDLRVISYPGDRKLSYSRLVEYVREKLPEREEVVLVAESFSGPIAYALASDPLANLKAVVFVATFIRPPVSFLWMMPPLALALLIKLPLPLALLEVLLFERDVENQTVELFKKALKTVKSGILAYRIREITGLQGEEKCIALPCMYIRAGNDRLVPRCHTEEFRCIAPQIEVIEIPGPHFIMQARPKKCVRAVQKYIDL